MSIIEFVGTNAVPKFNHGWGRFLRPDGAGFTLTYIQHSLDLESLDATDPYSKKQERAKLDNLVGQIATKFRLEGPEHCSTKLLRDALHEAAEILVYDDKSSRKAACRWLKTHGLKPAENCELPVPRQAKVAAINAQIKLSGASISGKVNSSEIECQ